MWWAHGPAPSGVQLGAASLIVAALLVMSPLHHLPLYIKQLRDAVAEERLRFVTLVNTNVGNVPDLSHPLASSIITIDFNSVRDILRSKSRNLG
jgi:hypothetical protein